VNREPWFVMGILKFVTMRVNPVFSVFRTAAGKLPPVRSDSMR
jgi:hypothetical protein